MQAKRTAALRAGQHKTTYWCQWVSISGGHRNHLGNLVNIQRLRPSLGASVSFTGSPGELEDHWLRESWPEVMSQSSTKGPWWKEELDLRGGQGHPAKSDLTLCFKKKWGLVYIFSWPFGHPLPPRRVKKALVFQSRGQQTAVPWHMGPTTHFCTMQEVRIVFTFLNGWKK